MSSVLKRRLTAVERKRRMGSRRGVVVLASDADDRDRQIAKLYANGGLGPDDALICVLGRGDGD